MTPDTPLAQALAGIRARAGAVEPRVAIVLGSGLGGLAAQVEDATAIPYADIPGFPVSTVAGHAGQLVLGRLAGVPVLLFAGRSHYYEAGQADVMALPLAVARVLGADTLLLSNAAGSTRGELGPGTLMMITDHVNWSGRNPLIGRVQETGFVDLTEAYDPDLRDLLRMAAMDEGMPLAEGVYGWFSGPSYETPAEVRLAAKLGIDAVGMSTVPETILARSLGLRVAAVSLITNLGAGIGKGVLDHEEVKAEGAKAADRFERLVVGLIRRLRV
ncbi:MAG: purine-nucleoside phosphorylase [Rhodobacteraceae bacterium]|nr:purine-nucleoside phosphorylase [Paracoccaceae bacterium]